MLFDRECINCDHVEFDRLEWVDQGEAAICPICAQRTLFKLPSAPSLISMAGTGSPLEFGNLLDARREKSRVGHGNKTIKATLGAHGLTIDDVVTNKA